MRQEQLPIEFDFYNSQRFLGISKIILFRLFIIFGILFYMSWTYLVFSKNNTIASLLICLLSSMVVVLSFYRFLYLAKKIKIDNHSLSIMFFNQYKQISWHNIEYILAKTSYVNKRGFTDCHIIARNAALKPPTRRFWILTSQTNQSHKVMLDRFILCLATNTDLKYNRQIDLDTYTVDDKIQPFSCN